MAVNTRWVSNSDIGVVQMEEHSSVSFQGHLEDSRPCETIKGQTNKSTKLKLETGSGDNMHTFKIELNWISSIILDIQVSKYEV